MISNVCLITLLLHSLACASSDLVCTSTRVFLFSLGLLNFSQNSGVVEIFGQFFLYFAIQLKTISVQTLYNQYETTVARCHQVVNQNQWIRARFMKSLRESICALHLNFDTGIQGQNESVVLHGSSVQLTRTEHTSNKRKHFQHLKTLVHTFSSYEKVSKI